MAHQNEERPAHIERERYADELWRLYGWKSLAVFLLIILALLALMSLDP